MKKVMSISVRDEIFTLTKEEAWIKRISVSKFVEGVLDNYFEKQNKETQTHETIMKEIDDYYMEKPNERSEDDIIADGQKKLEKVRAENNVSTPKGPVKANKAMNDFFNGGYSKSKQLGKKEK